MFHASLREDSDTIHGIEGESLPNVLRTAGLLAEAINRRNGYSDEHPGKWLACSVVLPNVNGRWTVSEYEILGCHEYRFVR